MAFISAVLGWALPQEGVDDLHLSVVCAQMEVQRLDLVLLWCCFCP